MIHTMKMYFFRGDVPNFGDELNEWLLPKVFPNFFNEDDKEIFLGIGSIISDIHRKHSQKIVFGSGYGGYWPLPQFDDTWKIYCVRGPRTASVCNLDLKKVAGDAAILVRKFRLPPKKSLQKRCCFMPHWQSVDRGNWKLACQFAGIDFIDPRRPVSEVLEMIEGSKMIITEAMHGAIVADALRVPWLPILPFQPIHKMKWFDWAEALDLTLSHRRIWPSSTLEAYMVITKRGGDRLKHLRGPLKAGFSALDWGFVRLASIGLSQAAKLEPMLSSDAALSRAIDRLETNAEQIRRDFAAR